MFCLKCNKKTASVTQLSGWDDGKTYADETCAICTSSKGIRPVNENEFEAFKEAHVAERMRSLENWSGFLNEDDIVTG